LKPIRIILISLNNNLDPGSTYSPPYGLEILHSNLPRNIADVKIITPFAGSSADLSRFRSLILEFRPHLIGVSIRNIDNCLTMYSDEERNCEREESPFFYLDKLRSLLKTLNEIEKDCNIIIGGAGFTGCPEPIMEYLNVDIGVLGPGEYAFSKIVEYMFINNSVFPGRAYVRNLPGTIIRENNTHFVRGRKPYNLKNESEFALIRDAKYIEYVRSVKEHLPVRTKTGCSLRCCHCFEHNNYSSPTFRPVEHVIKEVSQCIKEYRVNKIFLADSELNLPNENHIIELLSGLFSARLNRDAAFSGYFNINHFTKDLAEILQNFNFYVNLTIDSFDNDLLKFIGKDFLFDEIETVIKMCNEHRLIHSGSVIFGWPGETIKKIDKTINIMKILTQQYGTIWSYSPGIRLYPNTRLARYVRNKGFRHIYGFRTKSFLEPVVFCEAMSPRNLATHLAEAFSTWPMIQQMNQNKSPDARLFYLRKKVLASHYTAIK